MISCFDYHVDDALWAVTIASMTGMDLSQEDEKAVLSNPKRRRFIISVTGERSTTGASPAPVYTVRDMDGKPITVDALTEEERTHILIDCLRHFRGQPLSGRRKLPYAVTEVRARLIS